MIYELYINIEKLEYISLHKKILQIRLCPNTFWKILKNDINYKVMIKKAKYIMYSKNFDI